MTTPLPLATGLPLAELACAGYLWRRGVRKYPALLLYLLTEAAWHSLALWDYTIATRVGALFRMLTRLAVAAEVVQSARSRWPLPEVCKTAAAVLAGILSVTIGMGDVIRLSPWQSMFVFRQYFYVAMAAALWALVARAARWPMLENRRARAYRLGAACWLTAVAVPGTFVRGGLGYVLLPRTPAVWSAVNVAGYAAILVTVVAMGAALGWEPSRRASGAAARVVRIDRRAA